MFTLSFLFLFVPPLEVLPPPVDVGVFTDFKVCANATNDVSPSFTLSTNGVIIRVKELNLVYSPFVSILEAFVMLLNALATPRRLLAKWSKPVVSDLLNLLNNFEKKKD